MNTSEKAKAAGGNGIDHKPNTSAKDKDKDMGAALRSIYRKTVDEEVPAEMLDLLGKLD